MGRPNLSRLLTGGRMGMTGFSKFFLLLSISLLSVETAWSAKEHRYWYWSNPYRVLEPDDHMTYPRRPTLVLLHGCTQSSDEILEISGLRELVDDLGIYVIAPDQIKERNTHSCWNWFLPENQSTWSYGEPPFIRDLVFNILPFHAIDPDQIYLVGMSAGAGMAVNMMTLYPDSFAGVVTLAGVPFGVAKSLQEAQELLTKGSTQKAEDIANGMRSARAVRIKRDKKALFLHGTNDTRVIPQNTEMLYESFLHYADLADDGNLNGSQDFVTDTYAQKGPPTEFSWSRTTSKGENWIIEKRFLHGLEHKWPGSASKSPHAESRGPSFTKILIEFLDLE